VEAGFGDIKGNLMKKYCLDMTTSQVVHINEKYVLLKLTHEDILPEMLPGQFVEVRVDGSPTTFLRRPISINNVDKERNELHLLVACIGDGTKRLGMLKEGEKVNVVLPLGNGFSMENGKRLLVGGGVCPGLVECEGSAGTGGDEAECLYDTGEVGFVAGVVA
jgi:dihydroorotate dehydrogenase electron transfer subunit